MWNTGCNVVYNRTKRLLMIVDGEDPARTLIIEPNNEASFAGTKLPWADRDDEVTRKAFRVTTFSNTQGRFLGWFYICQDYRTNAATWVDWRRFPSAFFLFSISTWRVARRSAAGLKTNQ